jgi:aspartate aminotransferase-like enzyme
VVYTDRAVNLMSAPFQQCMVEISAVLKDAYQANKVVIIPGSGSFGMEAVARQFGQSKRCMVLRNGYFSFRWSDIFAVCKIPSEEVVLKARPTEAGRQPQFAPMPIAEVVAQIRDSKPDLVLAPHVETATGILLPDDYIAAVAAATHEHGGLFVLDCIASGNVWVDMAATGVDVLISAPQKGWTGPACCGLVMLSQNARAVLDDPDQQPEVNSFCCNLRKWSDVMDAYEDGGFMYYTTLPTDALMIARDVMLETQRYGFERCKSEMIEMGAKVRGALESRGFRSVGESIRCRPSLPPPAPR